MPKEITPTVVIHADTIVNGVAHRRCPNCQTLKPIGDFGLRNMTASDGTKVVREQSWCRTCR